MATDSKSKANIPFIGLLAVKNNLITKEDLQKAVTQCSGGADPALSLQEYFLSNKMISSENMQRLLRAAKAFEMRQKEFKFGAIAIRKGFINQSVLKLALEEQGNDMKNKKKVRLVGDILVEAGMLTLKQRDYIFKLQNRVRQAGASLSKKDQVPGENTKPGDKKSENKTAKTPVEQVKESGEAAVGLLEPEIIDGGIKLEISRDFMGAFLSKTEQFDENITLTGIKEALFDKGIVLGIVNDEMIEGFIRSSGFKTKSFRVAKGVVPIQGKDAEVEFFFNIDYLKAGGLTKDGTIDFKDRGEIPHVEEGTVLAEKIPMVASQNGHNIYGDEIETLPGNDVALKIGKGAKLSEDGVKILAGVKGFPKYALSGHVFVHQEYIAEGDVDYETGHINYNGNVTVKGRIKAGFKVKGNDISAVELDGGGVTADGNVTIAGGINEGKIYARGNVVAKFIHQSQIICMGDVIVEKEIVDSDVECSGICAAENGKFISSRITAKKGVKAKHIGTEMAEPNSIKVGVDAFTEKELEKNKAQADRLKKQIALHQENKATLKQENLTLQKQITELAHIQDRSQLEEKEIHSEISLLPKDASTVEKIAQLEKKIAQLKSNAQKAEKTWTPVLIKVKRLKRSWTRKTARLKYWNSNVKTWHRKK